MADGPRIDRPMARPMTPAENEAATPDTTADRVAKINKSGLPMVSSPRRGLSGRDATIIVGGVIGAVVAATAAASLYVDANHLRHTPAPTATQEGQAPIPDTRLQTNTPETQTGDPTLEIQNMLKTDVNEYYNGTISLENSTFTAINPEHPNSQQTVSLSQVEELCGVSVPVDSHIDSLGLTNALIVSNKDSGTMMIMMDGMVNGQKVILEIPWNPQTVKVEKKGLFVNTKVNNFVDGEPVVSDEHGNPQDGNQLAINIIDDQPATAGQ